MLKKPNSKQKNYQNIGEVKSRGEIVNADSLNYGKVWPEVFAELSGKKEDEKGEK